MQEAWGNNLDGQAWVSNQAQQHSFSFLNSQEVDIKNMLEKQIILLEPSPSKAKLDELRKKGQKFLDDRFPPNLNSLTGEWGNVGEWKDIKWKKLS